MKRPLPRGLAPIAFAGLGLLLSFAVPAFSLVPDHFESPPVHPVEMSADGARLFVCHTADHRLVVFDLTTPLPTRIAEIQVGLEPVTVRARTPSEVWVVNHVSDSISIVDLATGDVVRTLLVGDEPTDVVFVESQHRAFVCVSQRDLIRVYDTDDLSRLPAEISLSMSDPRSLALSPDRGTLYIGALDGQNETTVVPFETVLTTAGTMPPHPPMRPELPPAPPVALILKYDGVKWTDEIGRDWNDKVPYRLFDHDVLEIDTATLAMKGAYRGVGTTIFNLAVSPMTGRLYASNQEAFNEIRFEPNVRGKFVHNRVTMIDPGAGTVSARHLNEHIDYDRPDGDPGERELSLAIPTDVAISEDGNAVYVAAFGSRKVGVLDASGAVTRRLDVGEGPCGLALDEARGRLYVMNRFVSTLSVVELGSGASLELPLGFDPTPPPVREGRRFLYDATLSSAHGDLACASCHIFGATDGIGWDLGNPLGDFIRSSLPPELEGFHPMKGPLMTQSLKGLPGTAPFHWRGDRPSFLDFNPAFVSLMGRSTQLAASEMDLFNEFVFSMRYPPNPNRNLDDSLPMTLDGGNPRRGEVLFRTNEVQDQIRCIDCHFPPLGTNGLIFQKSLLLDSQDVKVPHLRNLGEKTRFSRVASTSVRGFGYQKDGTVADLSTFLHSRRFPFLDDADRRDLEEFLLSFPTGTHPAVGAQWTQDGSDSQRGAARVGTLARLRDANEIGLVAKGRDAAGEARGWMYSGGDSWTADRASEPAASTDFLFALAGPDHEVTFTGVLRGTETRLGVDRDEDGDLDRDELDAGTDPGDPSSNSGRFVGANPLDVAPRMELALWLRGRNPSSNQSRVGFALGQKGAARLTIFDVAGRRVRSLVEDAAHAAGRFETVWDLCDESGRRVSAGTYFVRLENVSGAANQKVVVLR